MDLGTMAQKVQAGEYTGVQQLRSDFKLVISNCRTYNRVGVSDEAGQFLDAAAKLELEGDALFDAALAPDGGSGQRRRAPPKVFVAGSASGRTKPRADTEQPSPAPRPPASSPRKKKQPSSSTAPKVESDVFEECPHCAPGSGKAKGHKGRHVSTVKVKATLPDGHKPRPAGRAPKGKRWDGTGWVSAGTGEGQAKRPPAPQPGEDPSGRINLVSAPSPRPPASSPRKAKQPPQPLPSSTPTAPAKAFPAKINSQPDQTVSRTAPCTACGGDVGSDQLTHPNLPGSLLCDECHERVSRPFKRDEEGIETCCRWCGYGGELMLCDECPSTFCKGCISRNIGAEELSELEKTKDDWACLRCNPSQVQSKKLVFSRPPAQATQPDLDKDDDMFEEESGEDESEEDASEDDESEEEYESEEEEDSEEEEEDSEEEDAMDQDTQQSVPELPKLGVGVSLDAKDSRGHWYRAKIVSMDESHVRGASHVHWL